MVEGLLVGEYQVQGQRAVSLSWRLVELDLVLGKRLSVLMRASTELVLALSLNSTLSEPGARVSTWRGHGQQAFILKVSH